MNVQLIGLDVDRELFQKQHGIIGESVEIKELVDVIQQVAPTDITVLITGESGVGKEIVARAIHHTSPRGRQRMVTVNCGAIPEGLIESELFGHKKGAFTDAVADKKGLFEEADGGTVFLDEIGEMPLATQVKILRVLESGEFMRVGSTEPRRVDVRVIAATNQDLDQEVRSRRFREDLFFRLRSVNIRIPPLRNRREDIPPLFHKFAEEFCAKNAITFEGISDQAMSLLMEYPWPGNVRELRNTVESMIVLERGKRLEIEDVRKYLKAHVQVDDRYLPVYLNKTAEQAERELILRALLEMKGDILEIKNVLSQQATTRNVLPPAGIHYENYVNDDISLKEMERRMITSALERFHGNRRLAARVLKISERTLYRKIKEYGL